MKLRAANGVKKAAAKISSFGMLHCLKTVPPLAAMF